MFAPDSGSPLINALQSDTDVVATVVFTPDEPAETLTKIEWETDMPEEAIVSVNADTLTVEIESLDFLFPVQTIKYLLNGAIGECFVWGDIPEEADEVIEYRPDPSNIRIYSLSVTATTSMDTYTETYEIKVTANYDTGKLLLVEAVNVRS